MDLLQRIPLFWCHFLLWVSLIIAKNIDTKFNLNLIFMPESERHHPLASPTNARCCQDWQKVCRVWRVWDALNPCYDVILTVTVNHLLHYQQTILAFVCCYRNVSFMVSKNLHFLSWFLVSALCWFAVVDSTWECTLYMTSLSASSYHLSSF